MDSCPSAGQLDRLLADRLDAGECVTVSNHVQDCTRCQDTLAQLTRLDADFPVGQRSETTAIVTGLDKFLKRMEMLSPDSTTHVAASDRMSVLDDTTVSNPELQFRSSAPGRSPDAIPGFEIISEVGRGGMAVVYKARQLSLKRLIALKMILSGGSIAPDRLSRFRSEAEAVARLHHPGIVQIYETGEHNGVPYLALEFVAGTSLAQKTRDHAQPPRQSAALIATIADAIDAAHRAGIIHRDLTPSNILLAGQPSGGAVDGSITAVDGFGLPKITDFGLAIDLAHELRQTRTGEVVGTPHYMAPEQAQGRRKDFGPATDIHALGVILYELLTGRPPFQGATAVDTLVQVSYEDPVPPTRLRAELPRDLEVICLKCLQKEPRHRYPSAQALAADLRRFLNGEPIQARPTSMGGRVIKWARRRPLIAGLAAASLLLTIMALASLSWALAQESRRRAQAEASEQTQTDLRLQAQSERSRAERLTADAMLDQAISQGGHGQIDRALLLLVRSLELAHQVGDRDLERIARINLTAWRQLHVRQRAAMTHPNWVWAVAYSPSGQSFVTASRDKTARLWDTTTGLPIGEPMSHDFPVWAVAFRPDGKVLATASAEERRENPRGELRFWDARSGRSLGPPLTIDHHAHRIAFGPDGRVLLSVGVGKALIWNLKEDGSGPNGDPIRLNHPQLVNAALSPDGTRVLTGGLDGVARLWQTSTGADSGVAMRHDLPDDNADEFLSPIVAVAFSPDGRTIATGNELIDTRRERFVGGEVRLWQSDGTAIGRSLAHRGPIKTVAFSPDGRRLLTGAMALGPKLEDDFTGEARYWDVETGKQLGSTFDQTKPVWAVGFSPDGQTLLTGSENGAIGFWVAATGLAAGSPGGDLGNITSVAFAPDGRTALTSKTYEPASATLWEAPQGRGATLPPLHTGPIRHVAFAADGKMLLSTGQDGKLLRWDLGTGRPIGQPLQHPGEINGLSVSRDGTIAATTSTDKFARVWDVLKGERLGQPMEHALESPAIVLSSDASIVLTSTGRSEIRRWDRASSRPIGDPFKHDGSLTHLAISPDGLIIASGGSEHAVRLWDSVTGRPIGELLRHGGPTSAMAFRPDGKILATSSLDQSVRFWQVPDGKLVGQPILHRYSSVLTFSPDGNTLVSGSDSQTAWLFDVATGKPRCPPLQHRGAVSAAVVSSDGRFAATISTGRDHHVYLWDVATGHQIGPPIQHPSRINSVAFHPDGTRFVTASEDGLIRIWDVPQAATGEAGHIRLWIETLTGMQLGEQGILQELDAATVAGRRQTLDAAGPEPFPRK